MNTSMSQKAKAGFDSMNKMPNRRAANHAATRSANKAAFAMLLNLRDAYVQ